MKLATALEIGLGCNKVTVADVEEIILFQRNKLFKYHDMNHEVSEFTEELESAEKIGIRRNTPIYCAISALKRNELGTAKV